MLFLAPLPGNTAHGKPGLGDRVGSTSHNTFPLVVAELICSFGNLDKLNDLVLELPGQPISIASYSRRSECTITSYKH